MKDVAFNIFAYKSKHYRENLYIANRSQKIK